VRQPGTFDVVVVGAIGIDTNVYTQAGSIDATVETHFTENLDYVGQSGGFTWPGENDVYAQREVTMSTEHVPHTGEGSVVALWRYPVKSMMGEELNARTVTTRGLLGDRAYALVDRSDGKVASAKNPRKWPQLFDFRAAFVEPPRPGAPLPPVHLTLPDGTILTSMQSDLNPVLSQALHREVTFASAERGQHEVVESTFPNPWTPQAEE
jgi:hypothetical protein